MSAPKQVGACTWIFGHHDYRRIARRIAALGFDGVELLTDIESQSAASLRALFEGHGLAIFSMTPDNVDLAHPDRHIRQQAVAYYERLIDFAAELGSAAVTCHEEVGRSSPHADTAAEWDLLVGSCAHVAERAEKCGVGVVFEPLNRSIVSAVHDIRAVLELVAAVGSERFGIVYDTYHMQREEPDPAAAIRACGEHLGLVQLADSNRRGLGMGLCDWPAQLGALADIGYEGPLILECSADLAGPSLSTRPVDSGQLVGDLRRSLRQLEALQQA